MSKTLTVTKNLNVRRSPDFSWPPVSYYSIGDTISIKTNVKGKDILGNSTWYQLDDDNYVWSGGTSAIVQAPVKNVVPLVDKGSRSFAWKLEEFVNDPYCRQLLLDPGGDPRQQKNWKVSWGHIDMEIWKIWKAGNRGQNVKVAVIDDGCWYQDNDLAGRVSDESKSVVDGFPSINSGDCTHGTHSAGLVGGKGQLVYGVAPGCELVIIKAGDHGKFNEFDIVGALSYAVDIKADIISMSLKAESNDIKAWIDECRRQSILVVAAAGNDGKEIKSFPASYEGVFSVGAYLNNTQGVREVYKAKSNSNDALKFVAPGNDVLTTGKNGAELHQDTSAATAFAAGALALAVSAAKARSKKISYDIIMNAIMKKGCCEMIQPGGVRNNYEGFGVLNPINLIQLLNN